MARRQLRRALDLDVGLHSDLHARVLAYRRWNELVAGNSDNFSRQRDRSYSNDLERACWHTLRHSVSGFLPRLVWNTWRQYSRAAARVCRLWVVRNSNLDRGQRHLQNSVNLRT